MISFLFKIIIGIFLFFKCLHIVFSEYFNSYKLTIVFGAPRSGKSTLLTKLSYKYLKDGKKVYSNVSIPGTYFFDPRDLSSGYPDPGSIVMIDEAGLIYDNRDFKSNFQDKNLLEFYKKFGHLKLQIFIFSQSIDIDKKLRDLCTDMWLVKKYLGIFSVARNIYKHWTLNHGSDQDGNRTAGVLVEDYRYSFPLFPSSWIFTFIPAWSSRYDSFEFMDYARVRSSYIPLRDFVSWKSAAFKNIKVWICSKFPQRLSSSQYLKFLQTFY